MAGRYILVDGEAVPEPDLIKWAMWYETADRQVALLCVGDAMVSTIFMGLDCKTEGDAPLLFETLIIGGPAHGQREHWSTLEQAMVGHTDVVQLLRLVSGEDAE